MHGAPISQLQTLSSRTSSSIAPDRAYWKCSQVDDHHPTRWVTSASRVWLVLGELTCTRSWRSPCSGFLWSS